MQRVIDIANETLKKRRHGPTERGCGHPRLAREQEAAEFCFQPFDATGPRDGWDTPQRCAARVKFSSSKRTRKYRIR
jgi:hypothetical protein